MKLSILIPTLPERKLMFLKLYENLMNQIYATRYLSDIEVLVNDAPRPESIGKKRNQLLQDALGDYIAFIDDDDDIPKWYLETFLDGIATNPDCIALKGQITIDGGAPEMFEHSLKYFAWKTNEGAQFPAIKYERFPNHLNCIKSPIAKQFKFPETNHGEDHEWSKLLFKSGLLKHEYNSNKILYFYNYINNKK